MDRQRLRRGPVLNPSLASIYRTLEQQRAIYQARKESHMGSTDDQIRELEAERDRNDREIRRRRRKIEKHSQERFRLETRNRAIQQRIHLLSRVPEPAGDLITFDKVFASGNIRYTYAAHRSGKLWYATGSTGPNGVTWEQLVAFARKDNVIEFKYEVRPHIASNTITGGAIHISGPVF